MNRMPKRILMSVVVAALSLLSGCLQMEQSVTIAADGSGTQKITLDLTEQVLGSVQRLAGVAEGEQRPVDPRAAFREDHVRRELAAAGMAMTAHSSSVVRGVQRLSIEARFEDVAALAKSPLAGGRAEWFFVRGTTKDRVRVVCYPQGRAAHVAAKARADEMERDGIDETEQLYFEQRRAQLRSLDVAFAVTLPGTVHAASANWKLDGERTLRARVTGKDVQSPRDLVLLLAPRFEAEFDASGTTWKVLDAEPELPRVAVR